MASNETAAAPMLSAAGLSAERVPASETQELKLIELEKVKATKGSFIAPQLWMLIFGGILAVCAGMLDVIAYIRLGHVFPTHMTGTTARCAIVMESSFRLGSEVHFDLRQAWLMIAFFVLGCFMCGLIIPKMEIRFGQKSFYGTALLGESVLLFLAAHGADYEYAVYLACMAAGLQNAMCTMHFGAVVRTTHVTGTLTDIGSTSGRAAMILVRRGCNRRKIDAIERAELEVHGRRLSVLCTLFASFLLGALAGTVLAVRLGDAALCVPAGVTGACGLIYTFLRETLKRYFKRYEMWRISQEVSQVESMLERTRDFIHEARVLGAGRRRRHGESDEQSSQNDQGDDSFEDSEDGADDGDEDEKESEELEHSMSRMLRAMGRFEEALEEILHRGSPKRHSSTTEC